MSVRCTLPLNFALTGPILMVATAWNSVGELMLSSSHPGMHCLSTSESLSFAHTTSRVAASWTSPFIVIAIAPSPVARTDHLGPGLICSRQRWKGLGVGGDACAG